jgi:hypothetical protein
MAMVMVAVLGVFNVLRTRRNRGKPDETEETRRAQKLEMERRMASYLASRDDR